MMIDRMDGIFAPMGRCVELKDRWMDGLDHVWKILANWICNTLLVSRKMRVPPKFHSAEPSHSPQNPTCFCF
jgi:hypothetical protein